MKRKKIISTILMGIFLVNFPISAFASEWLLHTGTKLEEAKTKFDLCLGDYNGDGKLDLYALKKYSSGSTSTEVHVLNGANNFQSFLLQTGTKLELAKDVFDFCLGDYNGDGKLDLYALKKSSTGSNSTEVHILNGANNFQSFLLQTSTRIEEAKDNFSFCLGDYNGDDKLDLYALKKSSTGSNSTEVHILDGANNFQGFLLQTATKLEEAKTKFDLCLGDYNGDGKLDLYALKKYSSGSTSTEVHVLNGANNFQNFLLQTGTKLELAKDVFDFCLGDYNSDGKLDLYALKKSSTGSNSTEVHVLSVDGSQSINAMNEKNIIPTVNTTGNVINSNLSKVRLIKQGSKTCKATAVAQSLNIIVGYNKYTTSSFGNVPCKNIGGNTYRSSNGHTYVATYKQDSYIGSKSEQQAQINNALSAGLPIVVAVHKTTSGTNHHWVTIIGKNGNTYDIIDPATGTKRTMASAKYDFGLASYSNGKHYGYVSFSKK